MFSFPCWNDAVSWKWKKWKTLSTGCFPWCFPDKLFSRSASKNKMSPSGVLFSNICQFFSQKSTPAWNLKYCKQKHVPEVTSWFWPITCWQGRALGRHRGPLTFTWPACTSPQAGEENEVVLIKHKKKVILLIWKGFNKSYN